MAQSCTGDCLKCSFQQQVYCAAQRTYGIMKNQEAIVSRLEAIEKALGGFAPGKIINLLEDSTQDDPGVENRGSK